MDAAQNSKPLSSTLARQLHCPTQVTIDKDQELMNLPDLNISDNNYQSFTEFVMVDNYLQCREGGRQRKALRKANLFHK